MDTDAVLVKKRGQRLRLLSLSFFWRRRRDLNQRFCPLENIVASARSTSSLPTLLVFSLLALYSSAIGGAPARSPCRQAGARVKIYLKQKKDRPTGLSFFWRRRRDLNFLKSLFFDVWQMFHNIRTTSQHFDKLFCFFTEFRI